VFARHELPQHFGASCADQGNLHFCYLLSHSPSRSPSSTRRSAGYRIRSPPPPLPGPWACWQCPRSPAASLATSAAAIGTALACRYLVLPVNMPGDLGLGDAKLAASTGAALGWIGWPALLSGIVAGFALGGVYGGMPLIADHATQLPLGPFLLLGTLTAIAV
jgi:prepilin signal peptidase PulO-like enzyme (type II secretory pathway)